MPSNLHKGSRASRLTECFLLGQFCRDLQSLMKDGSSAMCCEVFDKPPLLPKRGAGGLCSRLCARVQAANMAVDTNV